MANSKDYKMFFRNTLRRPFLLRYFETGSWDVLQAGLNLMCYPFHLLQLGLRHQCIFTSPPQMRKIGVFSNKHSSKVNNCSHTYVIRQKARKATLNWQRHRVRPFRGATGYAHSEVLSDCLMPTLALLQQDWHANWWDMEGHKHS